MLDKANDRVARNSVSSGSRPVRGESRVGNAPLAAFLALAVAAFGVWASSPSDEAIVLYDEARQRDIPIHVSTPRDVASCTVAQPCPVALISSGYGIANTGYSFLSNALREIGHLTVAVQHELPLDPPLGVSGDLFAARTPNWRRGAENLRFVRNAMRSSHPGFDWDHPVLIGHSNGGDISAWFIGESPSFAGDLVTLDNRRVPLPRGSSAVRLLSIRASDFQADNGVLPTAAELEASDDCVVRIEHARHNDMHDAGPDELKAQIADLVTGFLMGRACGNPA